METIFVVLWISAIVALPPAITWGWIRWAKHKRPRTAFSMLSSAGFTLATASAMLALSSVLYGQMIGGFPFYDPRLLRIYRWGGLLSLSGILLGVSGVWRPSALRWHAPLCAAGMLMFWVLAASGE